MSMEMRGESAEGKRRGEPAGTEARSELVRGEARAQAAGLEIRIMTDADISAVAGMEERCFPDAWSTHIVSELLTSGMDYCRVAFLDGAAAGYENVRVIGDEAELMRICTAPEFRGRGIGTMLLEAGLRDMREHGAVSATLEVRSGNVPAIRLYEAHGFQVEGRRKNYYRSPVEDALIYWNRKIAKD